MKYMLDTDIAIHVIRNRPATVFERLRSLSPRAVCISSITLAELAYGASKSSAPARNKAALTLFLAEIMVMSFDEQAAGEYGDIRADLERKGMPIGPNDLLIAAHARALGSTLVTNNVREFSRVERLMIEDWLHGP